MSWNLMAFLKELFSSAQVAQLRQHVDTLETEIAELKKASDLEGQLTFRYPPNSTLVRYYYKDGDEVPFCPHCWDASKRLIHLTELEAWSGGRRRDCRECRQTYHELRMNFTR